MNNISKREPMSSLLSGLQRDINQLFDPFDWRNQNTEMAKMSEWMPAIDIKDEKDQYLIHADIPGVDPKMIDVNFENGILTLKGEKESNQKEETKNYVRVERVKGSFMRQFSLPDSVEADKIRASTKHGVLEIAIPKGMKSAARKITIDTNDTPETKNIKDRQ